MRPLSTSFVLILIGVALIFASSVNQTITFGKDRSLNLFNLGWGFVLTGALLVGK